MLTAGKLIERLRPAVGVIAGESDIAARSGYRTTPILTPTYRHNRLAWRTRRLIRFVQPKGDPTGVDERGGDALACPADRNKSGKAVLSIGSTGGERPICSRWRNNGV